MDINWRSTIDDAQSGNWCKTTNDGDYRIVGNRQGVISGVVVEGIQRCFCMDIQKSKRNSTKANTTYNQLGHYYTIGTSNHMQIKSKLCYSNQTKYR